MHPSYPARLRRALRLLDKLRASPRLHGLDVGRGVNPTIRCEAKGANLCQSLMRTYNRMEALAAERVLRQRACHDPRWMAPTCDARGNVAQDGRGYIYVAAVVAPPRRRPR